MRKKLLFVGLLVALGASACAQNTLSQAMQIAEDSVNAQITVLSNKCEIEKARLFDIRTQFVKIDQARVRGVTDIKDRKRLEDISDKITAQKMRILQQLLPAKCMAQLTPQDLQRLTGIRQRK
jgi:gamma-glutamylcysteine synthetase